MNDKPSAYRVVIADDHEIIRQALKELLLRDCSNGNLRIEVIDAVENGLQAIASVKQHQPELLFLDISMPLASGAEIIHEIKRWSPDTRIAVFTGITAPGLLASVVQTGIDGLFSKGESLREISSKLPVLLQGGRYISPVFTALLKQGEQSQTLTERERQVLNMIVSGKSNKEIARTLNISLKTVEKHRGGVMSKLEVHSVAQLMARALKDGLIDPL